MTVNLQARPEASPENLARLVKSSEDSTSRVSATAEATLRQFIAGATLDDLMTDRRKVLLEKAESSVKEQLKSEGLVLSDLILVVERVQPPWSVLGSWRDSARALREAERIAIETLTSQELIKTETSAEVERLEGDSRTDAERIRLSAKSRKSTFESLVKARLGHPNLSDHRMFWTQLAEVLRNQPKVLLDTPAGDIYGTNAPKRHLIMPESPVSFSAFDNSKSSENIQRPGDSIPAQTTTKPGTKP
jgi:regulator of protease activity HflC (stomatin/prohibitin superfamily)